MMSDFFKSWRRKLGVVTLAMACLFTAGWIRTNYVGDFVCVSSDSEYVQIFRSRLGTLSWLGRKTLANEASGREPFYWTVPASIDHLEGLNVSQSWSFLGFQSTEEYLHRAGVTIYVWTIAYATIVIPLTIFTALLLLITPRDRNSAASTAAKSL